MLPQTRPSEAPGLAEAGKDGTEEAQGPPGISKYLVVDPESRWNFYWTLALTCILFYISVAVPLQMGFRLDPTGAWKVFEIVFDVFFILDLIMNFFLGA